MCVSAVHLSLQAKRSACVIVLIKKKKPRLSKDESIDSSTQHFNNIIVIPALTRLEPELVRVEMTAGGQRPAG